MIWDTHAHLDDPRFEGDFQQILENMRLAQITRVTNVGFDLPSSERSVRLAHQHESIYAAIGVHPHDAQGATDATWERLSQLAQEDKVIAWGEIGLDYYRDLSPRKIQQEVFIHQIELADQAGLPIIIHNRDAHQDLLNIVKAHNPKKGGVFHCYSGSWEMAKILLKLGFYLSFAGPLTFKNNRNTVEVAKQVPLDRFLVETDSPYLTPEPYRGKRNEPARVREVVARLGEIRGMEIDEVAQLAFENGNRLFGL
ncbi:hydrolase, TatD family [Desulfitobacterium dichloroeliminans LMG P-21439]|uniref:Hydrolase, TatD family n=1 Tax=Desulfitobacterium dichloroeliminans (strain LMG P-21439 / DCA1) TaxID=871963 RepID=L0F1A1_DESDL|nr:TatD family hydrolase [Desulfitobacterium dichloroeliminans]AGA67609.1 hydrolase, TatD family [Desulfitobacterium dichloroeliminans LMG P-21439]